MSWEAEPITNITANDLVQAPDHGPKKVDEAEEFLFEALSNGRQPQKELEREGRARGLSLRTLERAKQNRKVESTWDSRTSCWALPAGTFTTPATQTPPRLETHDWRSCGDAESRINTSDQKEKTTTPPVSKEVAEYVPGEEP